MLAHENRPSYFAALFVLAMALGSTNLTADSAVRFQFNDRNGAPVPDVVILSSPPSETGAALPQEAVIDQKNKTFIPHVLAIAPGTRVRFPNSDDTRHHVYSFSGAKTFELKLYRANEAPPVTFEKNGLVTLGCNIHDSMKAYVLVTRDEVHGISDANGQIELPRTELPETAHPRAWHPQLGEGQYMNLPDIVDLDPEVTVTLPFEWQQPQQGKKTTELESLLKRYKRP